MAVSVARVTVILACLHGAAVADSEIKKRGYVLSRLSTLPTDRDAVLYPLLEVKRYQAFLEGNLDLTVSGDRYSLRSDTSALIRASPAGCRDDSDLPGCFVINELYGSYDVVPDSIAVLGGRYRPSWGTALTLHPVEPMNPAPDPTDPTFQRLGAWTTQVEYSTDNHIATAAWYPAISHSALGTPAGAAAGLVGARYAWRPEGKDLSAIGFFDFDQQAPAVGAAGSMTLGESPFEIHGEALVHRRREIGTGTLTEGSCPITSLGIPLREEWDVTGIAGGRWDKGDGTLVNLEYFHNGDGMVGADFRSVLNTADLLSDMCPNGRLEPADPSEDGRPQQFSSTFLRRHYGVLSTVKPSFGDEGVLANLGATATAFVGLDDLSGVVSARLVYTVAQRAMVRVGGLVPFGGMRTQYGILPFHGIVLLDIQLFL